MKKSAEEKVAVTSDLEYAEMRALIKTIAEDKHALIHKLEIRHKATPNKYRVIARISRCENPAEPYTGS